MRRIKVPEVKCSKCHEVWLPRVAAPKKCPACQSRKWNEKEKV